MFEEKKPFPWKVPVLILVGLVVLSGGIYVGVKSRNVAQAEKTKQENVQPEKSKEAFNLDKYCEIWLHKKDESGKDTEEAPTMLEMVDESLLDKSKEEIIAYLEDKYPDREIESITKTKIVLSEVMSVNDASKSNKYTLELVDNFIGIYKYDSNGNRQLIEKTTIGIESLPQKVQDEIKNGIVVETEDEAYSHLESIGS